MASQPTTSPVPGGEAPPVPAMAVVLSGNPHSLFQASSDLEQAKERFIYERISAVTNLVSDDNCFYSHIDSGTAFIGFGYVGEDPHFTPPAETLIEGKAPSGGWKLHLAIDDTIPGNVAKAWNAIKDILIEERIVECKVIKKELSFARDMDQCGKQITIYQFFNPNRDWGKIINQIECALLRNDVRPGRFSPGDQPIQGSRFISYRNDLSSNRTCSIRPREARGNYNPYGHPDPFIGIAVSAGIPNMAAS